MTLRSLPLAGLFLCATLGGCSGAEPTPSSDLELDSDQVTSALSVEDVKQYDGCRDNGHSGGPVELGRLNADIDPATRAMFGTAECIVGRLTKFKGKFRPYNIQSFKNTSAGKTFFFKRVSENVIHEAPSECLKIKMTATVGATDVYVTITRVKQLPAVSPGTGLCSDNGET